MMFTHFIANIFLLVFPTNHNESPMVVFFPVAFQQAAEKRDSAASYMEETMVGLDPSQYLGG